MILNKLLPLLLIIPGALSLQMSGSVLYQNNRFPNTAALRFTHIPVGDNSGKLSTIVVQAVNASSGVFSGVDFEGITLQTGDQLLVQCMSDGFTSSSSGLGAAVFYGSSGSLSLTSSVSCGAPQTTLALDLTPKDPRTSSFPLYSVAEEHSLTIAYQAQLQPLVLTLRDRSNNITSLLHPLPVGVAQRVLLPLRIESVTSDLEVCVGSDCIELPSEFSGLTTEVSVSTKGQLQYRSVGPMLFSPPPAIVTPMLAIFNRIYLEIEVESTSFHKMKVVYGTPPSRKKEVTFSAADLHPGNADDSDGENVAPQLVFDLLIHPQRDHIWNAAHSYVGVSVQMYLNGPWTPSARYDFTFVPNTCDSMSLNVEVKHINASPKLSMIFQWTGAPGGTGAPEAPDLPDPVSWSIVQTGEPQTRLLVVDQVTGNHVAPSLTRTHAGPLYPATHLNGLFPLVPGNELSIQCLQLSPTQLLSPPKTTRVPKLGAVRPVELHVRCLDAATSAPQSNWFGSQVAAKDPSLEKESSVVLHVHQQGRNGARIQATWVEGLGLEIPTTTYAVGPAQQDSWQKIDLTLSGASWLSINYVTLECLYPEMRGSTRMVVRFPAAFLDHHVSVRCDAAPTAVVWTQLGWSGEQVATNLPPPSFQQLSPHTQSLSLVHRHAQGREVRVYLADTTHTHEDWDFDVNDSIGQLIAQGAYVWTTTVVHVSPWAMEGYSHMCARLLDQGFAESAPVCIPIPDDFAPTTFGKHLVLKAQQQLGTEIESLTWVKSGLMVPEEEEEPESSPPFRLLVDFIDAGGAVGTIWGIVGTERVGSCTTGFEDDGNNIEQVICSFNTRPTSFGGQCHHVGATYAQQLVEVQVPTGMRKAVLDCRNHNLMIRTWTLPTEGNVEIPVGAPSPPPPYPSGNTIYSYRIVSHSNWAKSVRVKLIVWSMDTDTEFVLSDRVFQITTGNTDIALDREIIIALREKRAAVGPGAGIVRVTVNTMRGEGPKMDMFQLPEENANQIYITVVDDPELLSKATVVLKKVNWM